MSENFDMIDKLLEAVLQGEEGYRLCKENPRITEKEIVIIQKATVYDLKRIIEADPDKTYTAEDIKKILDAYITGVEQ